MMKFGKPSKAMMKQLKPLLIIKVHISGTPHSRVFVDGGDVFKVMEINTLIKLGNPHNDLGLQT